MSNRLFQGIVYQMRDAVDRVIGVIDEGGIVIACSDLVRIGETKQDVRDELSYMTGSVVSGGYTYYPVIVYERNWKDLEILKSADIETEEAPETEMINLTETETLAGFQVFTDNSSNG